MYIPAAIFKNGYYQGQICIFVDIFFVILDPENVYLDTKIIFPSDLETEILRSHHPK